MHRALGAVGAISRSKPSYDSRRSGFIRARMSERLSAKRVELAAAPGMYADGHGLYLRVGADIVFILNRYFEAMRRAVEAAGGRLGKFIGDGVMALFGIEGDSGAARLMSSHLADLNEVTRRFVAQWRDRRFSLKIFSIRWSRQMCREIAHLQWDDRLDVIPPLAGSLVAFISLFIVVTIVVGQHTAATMIVKRPNLCTE
jgi:hypothetical protein